MSVYQTIASSRSVPCAANVIINAGDMVQRNAAGYLIPVPTSAWSATASQVLGFAQCSVDMTGQANGAFVMNVEVAGAKQVTLSGVTVADLGKKVYANGPDSVTLTAASNTPLAGQVWQLSDAGQTKNIFIVVAKDAI